MTDKELLGATENIDIDFAIGILLASMVIASTADFTEGDAE